MASHFSVLRPRRRHLHAAGLVLGLRPDPAPRPSRPPGGGPGTRADLRPAIQRRQGRRLRSALQRAGPEAAGAGHLQLRRVRHHTGGGAAPGTGFLL